MHLKEGFAFPELVTLSQILTRIAEEEEGYLQNTCRHHPFASVAFSDSRHDLLTKIRFSFLHSGHDHVSPSRPERGCTRDLAYDAEDVLDECWLVERHDHSHCFCTSTHLVFRYQMGRKIRDVQDRLQSIRAEAADLQFLQAFIEYILSVLGQIPKIV
eukprot:Gb_06403 [translate_table: standard]